jgi:hypothetical protein
MLRCLLPSRHFHGDLSDDTDVLKVAYKPQRIVYTKGQGRLTLTWFSKSEEVSEFKKKGWRSRSPAKAFFCRLSTAPKQFVSHQPNTSKNDNHKSYDTIQI